MNTWKIILATLAIFGAGVMTGGLLVGYSDRAARAPSAQPAAADRADLHSSSPVRPETAIDWRGIDVRENRPPLLRKAFLDRLSRELELTSGQRERIEQAVREGQDRTRELWRVELAATRQRIRAELTPEQQARFQELLRPRRAAVGEPVSSDHSSPNTSNSPSGQDAGGH